MRKVFPVLMIAALFVSCGIEIPDVNGIKNLFDKDLKLTITPENNGVTIDATGLPDKLPTGLHSIIIFIDTVKGGMSDTIAKGVTDNGTWSKKGLENGKPYYIDARGIVTGDTMTTMGFGGKFYPRPWGNGSYLGYEPDSNDYQGVKYDRKTGAQTNKMRSAGVDFYFTNDNGSMKVMAEGDNGIYDSGEKADKWLFVQDGDAKTYVASADLKKDKIYQFKTNDDYYGKFVVDSITAAGTATPKVWMRYAFQTAKGVAHY